MGSKAVAAADAVSQMLGKIPVDIRIDVAYHPLGVDLHPGFKRRLLRAPGPWNRS